MPMATVKEQREYQRLWMAKRRREFLDGKCCMDCGTEAELEIHHRDPTQKVTHSVFSWRKERRDVELAKCDIVCRECHVIRHRILLGSPMHGTRRSYDHGCRCHLCRMASATQRQYYKIMAKKKKSI